jgi:hypothetical protein
MEVLERTLVSVIDQLYLALKTSVTSFRNVSDLVFCFFPCRPEGGILHVHENVKDTSESQWLDYLVAALSKLSTGHGNHCFLKLI